MYTTSRVRSGEEGVAASDMYRPKAKKPVSANDNRRVNVYSMGEFGDAGTAIVIVRIQHNKIYETFKYLIMDSSTLLMIVFIIVGIVALIFVFAILRIFRLWLSAQLSGVRISLCS